MSLRERKKLATRSSLVENARRLFREKGYESTTLEEICRLSNIHVTTFFGYFESKEELAFAETLAYLQKFEVGLLDPDRSESVLDYWCNFVDHVDVHLREEEAEFLVASDAVPALQSRFARILRRYEALLAKALAFEDGVDPKGDIYSKIKASALIAVHVSAARWALANEEYQSQSWEVARLVTQTFPSRDQVERLVKKHRSKATS